MDKLSRQGHLSLREEAAIFGVSTMTIRRDIAMLEHLGMASKSQGGAVARFADPAQLWGEGRASDSQKRIARKVIEYIPAECTVMLSGGSTTLEVARQLAATERHLSVVTNSLPVAAALFQTRAQVILTGGSLRANSMDLVGPVAEKNIDEYYIDILISGCDGALAEEGFFTGDINLAVMESKSVKKSRKVFIVTESAKFGRPAFSRFAETGRIAMVFTDNGVSDHDLAALRKAGVEVVIC